MAQVMPSFHWDGRWWSVITFHSETMNSKAQPSVVVLGEPNYSLCIYRYLLSLWNLEVTSRSQSLLLWAQSGSQGGTAHIAPGSFLLSELCVANGFVMKDGFVYHQLPESEKVALIQSTREKKREQDGRLLGWSLVNSIFTGHWHHVSAWLMWQWSVSQNLILSPRVTPLWKSIPLPLTSW